MRRPSGPFPGSQARARGQYTRSSLHRECIRLLPDVYVIRGVEVTPALRARAAACWGGSSAVLTGWSAAALLGSRWVPRHSPAEIALATRQRTHTGLVVRQCVPELDEVTDVDGIAVTTAVRTAYDLGRRLPLVDAVAASDELCWMAVCGPERVGELATRHSGDRGLAHLRRVLDLVDAGAQSPKESWTRVVLIRAGLPRPETQLRVLDDAGHLIGFCDLGWRRWKVVLEYDGEHHRSAAHFTKDTERNYRLEQAGWLVIHVNAALLRRPDVIVDRVSCALRRAGARW